MITVLYAIRHSLLRYCPPLVETPLRLSTLITDILEWSHVIKNKAFLHLVNAKRVGHQTLILMSFTTTRCIRSVKCYDIVRSYDPHFGTAAAIGIQ